ncbi:hypothetical protein FGO68_gene12488 [Halteria grandinella]|uniref:Uncharacterized protein n=1 Tax=Halteria grandinella TaxID=5974 RepID=A0A8J8NFP4_HALGN|nr:hypothetical protein FGO68_gene12488 [Halteria grandinella]
MASSYSPQRLLKRDRSSKRSLSRDKPELQKQSLKFRSTYSKKDFQIAEEIISEAEKIKVKANNKKGSQQAQHSKMLSLSDIIEGYNKVMAKIGIDTNRENRYYSMMVKLSINQKGKTWREALNLEYKVLIYEEIIHIEELNERCRNQVQQTHQAKKVPLPVDSGLYSKSKAKSWQIVPFLVHSTWKSDNDIFKFHHRSKRPSDIHCSRQRQIRDLIWDRLSPPGEKFKIILQSNYRQTTVSDNRGRVSLPQHNFAREHFPQPLNTRAVLQKEKKRKGSAVLGQDNLKDCLRIYFCLFNEARTYPKSISKMEILCFNNQACCPGQREIYKPLVPSVRTQPISHDEEIL